MKIHAAFGVVLLAGCLALQPARADEVGIAPAEAEKLAPVHADRAWAVIDRALGLVGIRYHRGGRSSETGFDCSGFVGHVFAEVAGLVLPRTAHGIAKAGTAVAREDLRPGDLVFFNTLRHAFSHVGIYLGDGTFVHAPRPGKLVRVEDMRNRYWSARYNGARRLESP